jgi:hypothetical protein
MYLLDGGKIKGYLVACYPQHSGHSRHPVKAPKLVIRSRANFGCPLRLSTDSGYRPLCQGIGWKKKEKEERRAECRGFD